MRRDLKGNQPRDLEGGSTQGVNAIRLSGAAWYELLEHNLGAFSGALMQWRKMRWDKRLVHFAVLRNFRKDKNLKFWTSLAASNWLLSAKRRNNCQVIVISRSKRKHREDLSTHWIACQWGKGLFLSLPPPGSVVSKLEWFYLSGLQALAAVFWFARLFIHILLLNRLPHLSAHGLKSFLQ